MSGDTIVAVIGVVMAAFILSRNSTVSALPLQRKVIYALAWAAIIAISALFVGRLLD